ncbi:MAG: hypothetical protein ABSG82_03365 [Sedimentisphaerales bacterium]|jgi:hypothetical protein
MNRWENGIDVVNVINLKISGKILCGSLCLILVGLWLSLPQPAYGQGTLGETATVIEVQQQLDGSGSQPTPNQPANKLKAKTARRNDANEPLQPAPEANNAPGQRPAGERTAVAKLSEEANAPEVNDFNEAQRELNRINVEAKNEEGQWLGHLERKEELAKAIDELVIAELRFIRKFAVAEDANKTTKAIDLVLKQRKEQLDKLMTKLDNEAKDERQRRERTTNRTTKRPTTKE